MRTGSTDDCGFSPLQSRQKAEPWEPRLRARCRVPNDRESSIRYAHAGGPIRAADPAVRTWPRRLRVDRVNWLCRADVLKLTGMPNPRSRSRKLSIDSSRSILICSRPRNLLAMVVEIGAL